MPVTDSAQLGRNVKIFHPALVNPYGCTVGDDTKIGSFVQIQKDASTGARCKISSHTFIYEGVQLEDKVCVGHGVMFTNDRFPRAANADGSPQTEADWRVKVTRVKRTASIGSNATVVSGTTIGEGALIGVGAVVTKTSRITRSSSAFPHGSSATPGRAFLGQRAPVPHFDEFRKVHPEVVACALKRGRSASDVK